jgi:hypothetical protein
MRKALIFLILATVLLIIVNILSIIHIPNPKVNINKDDNIIILIGSSNMMGSYQKMFLKDISAVVIKNPMNQTILERIISYILPPTDNLGPGYFASIKIQKFLSTDIVVIDCTASAQQIDGWKRNNTLYKWCINNAKKGNVRGILIYEGENDAGRVYFNDSTHPLNLNWDKDINEVVTTFRNDLNNSYIPVVWAQIGIINNTDNVTLSNWEKFKRVQLKTNISNSIMIITDDQPVITEIHHSKESNILIGDRYYNAWRQIET